MRAPAKTLVPSAAMVTCQQFVEHVNLELEGAVSANVDWAQHARTCENCARYLAQSQALARAVRQVGQRPAAVVVPAAWVTALTGARRRARPGVGVWAWLAAVAAVAVSALSVFTPAAHPPALRDHPPCVGVILLAGILPVAGVWLALRWRQRTLPLHAAAAVAAVCALAGQALSGLRCPNVHLQKHLLVSHFGALVLAVLLALLWSRMGRRGRPSAISHRG